MEIAPESDLELARMATDFLRKHPETAGLDIRSLRVRSYDRIPAEAVSRATSYPWQKVCISFSLKGEPHDAEFLIEDRRGIIFDNSRTRLKYAVLDGRYDLLANKEIW